MKLKARFVIATEKDPRRLANRLDRARTVLVPSKKDVHPKYANKIDRLLKEMNEIARAIESLVPEI